MAMYATMGGAARASSRIYMLNKAVSVPRNSALESKSALNFLGLGLGLGANGVLLFVVPASVKKRAAEELNAGLIFFFSTT